MYTCQAQNSVGTSDALSVQLDIKCNQKDFIKTFKKLRRMISFLFKDPPRILSAGPDRLTTAPLFSPAAFECVAEGNPSPSYRWVQR
jgi:hypothetical protein